jgi:hypothetical protein
LIGECVDQACGVGCAGEVESPIVWPLPEPIDAVAPANEPSGHSDAKPL